MKVTDKTRDICIVINALGWILIVAACMTGFQWPSMYLIGFMVTALMINGASHKGGIDRRFFIYPIMIWFILYFVAMYGMQYFYFSLGDEVPPFLILGQHPSGFFMQTIYWIGSVIVVTGGLLIGNKYFLPKQDWDEFLDMVKEEGGKS